MIARIRSDDPTAAAELERGAVLIFDGLAFPLGPEERRMIADGVAGTAKNISYNPKTGLVTGIEGDQPALRQMMLRFGDFTQDLVQGIAPGYREGLTRGRTSFRPAEIAGRKTSWRKDDTRRHVDAFPSTPTRGTRILRLFANVDQSSIPRCWRVGPGFETYAQDFLPDVKPVLPGAAWASAKLGITKSCRTKYDQLMLGLHDAAKRDLVWQKTSPAQDIAFLPGEVWAVYTDQMPHAALSGRNALEQSFYVDPDVLSAPEQAPLAILSRLTGQDLRRDAF